MAITLPPEVTKVETELSAHYEKLAKEKQSITCRDNFKHGKGEVYKITSGKMKALDYCLNLIIKHRADPKAALLLLTQLRDGSCHSVELKHKNLNIHRSGFGKLIHKFTCGLFKPKTARLVDDAVECFEKICAGLGEIGEIGEVGSSAASITG